MKQPNGVGYLVRVSAMVVLNLIASAPSARAEVTDPATLFAAERTAVGGDAWNRVVAIRLTGIIVTGGAPGNFTQIIDARDGHSRMVVETGGLRDESGFDGASWDKQNGILTIIDLPTLAADAETQAFVARHGWWNRSEVASTRLLAADSVAGVLSDGVEVTPASGSDVDLWFDRKTHLVSRTVVHADDGDFTTVYSDWRSVDGVRLPFRQVQFDLTGEETTFNVRLAAADPRLAWNALQRPRDEAHGTLVGSAISTVPFQLSAFESGHILVEALINGKTSILIFDSGGANYFAPEAAQRFGLTTAGGVNIGGVGTSSVVGGVAKVGTIAIGTAVLRDEAVIVGPLPYVALHPRAGIAVDGLAGFEFLSEFRTTVDYARHTMTFASFGQPTDHFGVALPFYSDGHSIYVEGTVDGATGLFRLDTGDGGALTVFRTFAAGHSLFQGKWSDPDSVDSWRLGNQAAACRDFSSITRS